MFYYDQNGSVSSVLYNGVMYYYIKNLQGEIMQIVDENGNSIAIYAYDQWGKPTQMRQPTTTTVDLVNYNPFLYRGYVYDSDSGLYYLQSRYYDPVTGRFLNADGEEVLICQQNSILQANLFTYGYNNPIVTKDVHGNLPGWVVSGIVHVATRMVGGVVGWAYYFQAKCLIFAAANLFLLFKGYTLSQAMFNHGMWGYGTSMPSYIKNKLIERLKDSSIMKAYIKSLIKKIKKSWVLPTKSFTVRFEIDKDNLSDTDLYYSIHIANCRVHGQLYCGVWYVYVSVSDTYDFTEIQTFSSLTFGHLANDLGFLMQKIGMMIPYSFSVSYRTEFEL